jgi:hypothetical protein
VAGEIDAHSKEKHNCYLVARHQSAVGRAIHSLQQLISPPLVHETHNRLPFVVSASGLWKSSLMQRVLSNTHDQGGKFTDVSEDTLIFL